MSLASLVFPAVRPLLHALDAETAHGLTIRVLRHLPGTALAPADPLLKVRAFGLDFPNPLGLAAGFDKNAEVPGAMLGLGFGFTEVGTVTPRPQQGNPRPRLFRLTEDLAVINRMGFNNQGHAAALRRLEARRAGGIIGVNIGGLRVWPCRASLSRDSSTSSSARDWSARRPGVLGEEMFTVK